MRMVSQVVLALNFLFLLLERGGGGIDTVSFIEDGLGHSVEVPCSC